METDNADSPTGAEAEAAAQAAQADARAAEEAPRAAAKGGEAAPPADGAAATAEAPKGEAAPTEAPKGEAAPKGDLAKALKAERDQRRQLRDENGRLRALLDRIGRPDERAPKAEGPQDEELLDGRAVRRLLDEQRRELLDSVEGTLERRARVETVLRGIDEFEVFRDETVGALARRALEAALTQAKTLDEAEAAIEETARQASALLVGRAGAEAARGAAPAARTLPQSPRSQVAAHIRLDKVPETLDEANAQARSIVRQVAGFVKERIARGGAS